MSIHSQPVSRHSDPELDPELDPEFSGAGSLSNGPDRGDFNWGDDADLADAAFFSSLDGVAVRPEGEYHFNGAQGRYALTWRQEAFARHYATCGNGAEAARRAGYSVQSARFIAHENLQNSKIRWRIRAIAEKAEARSRDETEYLIRMLNAAMEMALAQGHPNAMIRALTQMARLAGLDRPPTKLPATSPTVRPVHAAGEEDEDLALDAEATLALALAPSPQGGLLQQAVLGDGPSLPDAIPDPVLNPKPDPAPEPGPPFEAVIAGHDRLPNIPLHSPTQGENSSSAGKSAQLAGPGLTGRLMQSMPSNSSDISEGGRPWSS